MLPLLFLLCLLPVGDAQSELQERYSPEKVFVLPKYPWLAARAYINADFDFEVKVGQAGIYDTAIISIGQRLHADFIKLFRESIEKALQRWRFPKSGAWRMKYSFRSIRTTNQEGRVKYYIYTVDGTAHRVDVKAVDDVTFHVASIPKEIIVEFHAPLPELQGDVIVW